MTTYGNKRLVVADPRHQLSTMNSKRSKVHNLDALGENSIEVNMKHARQRNNIASADYTMNSRLSHLIVDDFNDYAALLGINQVLPDTLPHTTNTPVEGYLKTEDSILSQSNQR